MTPWRPKYTRPVEWFVYSRGAIERVAPHDVPHVVISITSAADDVARIPRSSACRGVLRLSFADIDEADGDLTLFSAEHAVEILEFVFKHRRSIERVVLHCDAGLSRSPGVAAAVARIMGDDDVTFFRRHWPNGHVYRTLLETFERERERRGWLLGTTDPLVPVFMPSLVSLLLRAEQDKGAVLTSDEALGIRDTAICMMVPASDVSATDGARGYLDIDPQDCWAEWQALRPSLVGEEDPRVAVFTPPLVTTLLRAEREKASPLTNEEVIRIRDEARCTMERPSTAAAIANARGYRDVDPENCWVEWQAVRVALLAEDGEPVT